MSDYFNDNNINHIDYKDTEILKRFLTEHGRIQHRRNTGLSSRNQRDVAKAIKRARFMGLLPYVRT